MGKFADMIRPENLQLIEQIKKTLPRNQNDKKILEQKTQTDKKILEQRTKANKVIGSIPDKVEISNKPKTILRKKAAIIIKKDNNTIEEIKKTGNIFPEFTSNMIYTDSGMLTKKGLVFRFYESNRKKTIDPISFSLQESLKDKSLFDKAVEKQLYQSFDNLMKSAMIKAETDNITRKELLDYILKGISGIKQINFDNLTFLDI